MHDYLFWAKMSPYMLLFDSYTFENFGKYFPNWHKLANSWQKMMFLRGKSYPTWLFHPAQLFSNQKLSILHIYSILHNYSIVKSTLLILTIKIYKTLVSDWLKLWRIVIWLVERNNNKHVNQNKNKQKISNGVKRR